MVLEDWVLALTGSPWVLLALYAFATIDGFFPPVPSESVLIALAALAVSTGEPNLWLLVAVGSAGAFTGDQIAYSIGRRIPVHRHPALQGPRTQRTLRWAEHALSSRGASFIIAARYVPVGRVAVNMTAGSVGFDRRRFSVLTAIAAVTWSLYSVLLGVGAGVWFRDNPLLAIVAGVIGGVLLGLLIEPMIKHIGRRSARWPFRGARSRSGVTAGAAAPESDPSGTGPDGDRAGESGLAPDGCPASSEMSRR
ncbi:DedA family protein [Actinotalea sp. K2]|uniref:DedA family protein n=1 Tax=Actinotalea sp. K2 TaxID=2939438 RepID=UPI0020170D3D|nr:DedA family protein [Actinotalea sp. K2]MCL3859989.1 DedA family protein [Actinotalea sp. K2]